jgi:tetratricopeptide (TPR) repeat protein
MRMFKQLNYLLGSLVGLVTVFAPFANAADDAARANSLFANGFELLKKNSYVDARSKFLAGLQLDATSAMAHFYLAQCDEAIGNIHEAENEYIKSLQLQPQGKVAKQARTALAVLKQRAPDTPGQKSYATNAPEARLKRAFSHTSEQFDKVDAQLNVLYTKGDGAQWIYDICSLKNFYWSVGARWNGTLAETHLRLKSEACSGQKIGDQKEFTSCGFDVKDSPVVVMGTVDASGEIAALTEEDIHKAVAEHFAHGTREDAHELKASLEDLRRTYCTRPKEEQPLGVREAVKRIGEAAKRELEATRAESDRKRQAEVDKLNAQFMKH